MSLSNVIYLLLLLFRNWTIENRIACRTAIWNVKTGFSNSCNYKMQILVLFLIIWLDVHHSCILFLQVIESVNCWQYYLRHHAVRWKLIEHTNIFFDKMIIEKHIYIKMHFQIDDTSCKSYGPSCSKLTTSLVNDSLKFKSSDTRICWNFLLKKCE